MARRRAKARIAGAMVAQLVGLVLFMAVFVVAMVFAKQHQDRAWEERNQDPRVGVVDLYRERSGTKECDGTTLLYRSYGSRSSSMSAIPDSPECAP